MPLKPGFHFWKALAKAPQLNLQVNIPDSLLYLDVPYLLYTDEITGKIVRKPDSSYSELEGRLLSANKIFIDKYRAFLGEEYLNKVDFEKNSDLPFIVSRTPGTAEHLCSKVKIIILLKIYF